MESIFLLSSIFVIFSLAVRDVVSDKCRVRYCNAQDIGCSCDSLCWRRQDCCLNYLNQTNVGKQTYYFGIPKAHIERGQLYLCQAINRYRIYGRSVISKCGDPVKDMTDSWLWQKSLCEQPVQYDIADDTLLRIPVSSNSTGETYKNIYCAACHNNLEDIVFWNTNAVCPEESRVSNLTEALRNLYVNESSQHPICSLEVEPPPNVKTFQCPLPTIEFISTCPPSFMNMSTSPEDADKRREIEWLCHVTRNMVNISGIYYNNLYCAACHFNETDVGAVVNSKHGACSRYVPDFIYSAAAPAGAEKSFPVLLDFDSSSTKGNTVGLSNRCPSGMFYDIFNAKCRFLVCSNGYHYYNGHCQRQTLTRLEGDIFGFTQLYEKLEESETSVNMSSCHKMRIELSEATVNGNGTLTLNQHTLYPIGTFEIVDNDSVHVCVNLEDNYVFDFRDDTHTYLTLVCSSLSLIALLLKIMIFFLISDKRKFSDKLVFCLSVSLFIAQLLFLTTTTPSTTNYMACASVGVLTHYFFLSSFCWMNVLAYDIWNTLSQCIESRFIHTDILKRRFCCYSLYAWVTPLIIVSAACVFDWSGMVDESSIMRPHYGVDLCWINTRTALLFYFAIPMALLLLTNIAFFVLTTISICKSSRAFPNVQSTENFQNCCHKRSPHHLRFSVYIKLCVIMGFTWISGFVASVSGQRWLWYLFTLSSASQGVYVLIAFTPFKKVLQIMKNRFHSHGNNNFNLHAFNLNVGNGSTQNEIDVSNRNNHDIRLSYI